MAEVFCNCCGHVFDAASAACPRCGRCPCCGSKVPEGAGLCPSCAWPTDDLRVSELLDPTLPANEKAIRDLEKGWQRDRLIGRINPWKLFAVALALTPLFVLIAACLASAIGLSERWTMPFMLYLFMAGYYGLIRLLESGRLRWFLRD